MGPKHNEAHFKSLSGCLLINSWYSSQHLHAGKISRLIRSLPSHLVIYFRLVKWFRYGWQDWWGRSGKSLLRISFRTPHLFLWKKKFWSTPICKKKYISNYFLWCPSLRWQMKDIYHIYNFVKRIQCEFLCIVGVRVAQSRGKLTKLEP